MKGVIGLRSSWVADNDGAHSQSFASTGQTRLPPWQACLQPETGAQPLGFASDEKVPRLRVYDILKKVIYLRLFGIT
jgi:hypothetical protein